MTRAVATLGVLLLAAGCGGGGGGGGSTAPASVAAPIGGGVQPSGNHAPLVTSAPPTSASVGVAWRYAVAATDADGDRVTLALAASPGGAALDPLTGVVTWTPSVAQVGTQSFSVVASDGAAQTTQSWKVLVSAASAPGATPPGGVSSGGRSTQKGTFTRTVTTAAQPGLPSIQVSYKVLVPSGYDATKPAPFLVSELTPLSLWAPIAQAEGFIVAEQQGYKGTGAWTFDYDVLAFDALLQDVQATWNCDVTRIYLTGFSAGAHWTYAIGLANADQFAGLGISAGAMRAAAVPQGVWPTQVPRKIAVAIRHGTTDSVVPVAEGRGDRDRLRSAGHPVDFLEFAGGHTVETAQLREIWGFLKDKRRP